MRPRIALLGFLFAAMAARCIVFTGGTAGYGLNDASAGGAACTSALDCADAGSMCCLSASTSVGGTCQTNCAGLGAQLCGANAECGDGGSCSLQTCNLGGDGSVTLRTCGLIATCQQQQTD